MKKIHLKECGILPNTDITLALHQLFTEHNTDTEFIFEKADYYLAPHPELFVDYRISNSDVLPFRVLGIWMKEMKNCILNGNGATFYCSGHMQPITMDHCENIKIENCTIDWKKPLVAEGIVTGFSDTFVELYIDPELFPHRLVNNWLEFDVGADEWYPLQKELHIQFNATDRCVTRNSGDNFNPTGILDCGNNVYRMYVDQPVPSAIGNIMVLRHNFRRHAGIFAEKCRSVTVENVTVHSCGGLGCLAQFCEDLTYHKVHFVPNTAIGRKVANGRDDGMHLTCNSGHIRITECDFIGLMDDPINVHGCCVTADEVVDAQTLRCRYQHEQAQGFLYWAEAQDEIVFIYRNDMSAFHTAKAEKYTLETMDTFLLRFTEPLPEEVLRTIHTSPVALDNLTHTASFECDKNRFGSGRARGILVSTPKEVRIHDNLFESSGAAILVAGDANGWYESGECHDVQIFNNFFTDSCLSSMYQFCNGIISVCPVVPNPDNQKPFHKHIHIKNNVFDSPNTPILYGFSCQDLRFEHNRIFHSPSAERWHPDDYDIRLSHCVDATIAQNDWIGIFDSQKQLCTENCERVTVEN